MQVNKMNARKEFFRVSLTDIHQEIEELKQGEDFTVKVWTDKAIATEYRESLDIENDPQKKEKWLAGTARRYPDSPLQAKNDSPASRCDISSRFVRCFSGTSHLTKRCLGEGIFTVPE